MLCLTGKKSLFFLHLSKFKKPTQCGVYEDYFIRSKSFTYEWSVRQKRQDTGTTKLYLALNIINKVFKYIKI